MTKNIQENWADDPVQDLAGLKAIDTTLRMDGVLCSAYELGSFKFSTSSLGTADDINLVDPTVGGGQWARVTPNRYNVDSNDDPVFDHVDVDNITIDGNAITSTSGVVNITPLAGQNLDIVLSTTGDLTIDGTGVVYDTSLGRVGIGTASPTKALDVVGTINASVSIIAGTATDLVIIAGSTGAIEIIKAAGNGLIDFKTGTGEDFDCRIIQNSDGLDIFTGGDGGTSVGFNVDSSQNVNIANGDLDISTGVYKVATTEVLSGTTLGSGVLASSLTSVGTLTSLVVSGAITSGSGDDSVLIAGSAGSIEIIKSAGNPFIDFKDLASDAFDCRIIQNTNGLDIFTGGNGSTVVGFNIDSSQNVNIANGDVDCTTGYYKKSVETGITASTTQSQGQQPLTTEIADVTTVANTNDVVTLITAVLGRQSIVMNNGANTLQVFAASGDTVDGGSSATITAGNFARYVAISAAAWKSA